MKTWRRAILQVVTMMVVILMSGISIKADVAVTGKGNSEKDPYLVNTWSDLVTTVAESEGPTYIKLTGDVEYKAATDKNLVFSYKTVTLDLAGHSITG